MSKESFWVEVDYHKKAVGKEHGLRDYSRVTVEAENFKGVVRKLPVALSEKDEVFKYFSDDFDTITIKITKD